jgi:hypothetical protein
MNEEEKVDQTRKWIRITGSISKMDGRKKRRRMG